MISYYRQNYLRTRIMIYKNFAEIYLILPHSGSQKRQNWDEVK